jgi:hypothetical protein
LTPSDGLVAGRIGAGFGALPGVLAFFIKVLVGGFTAAMGFAADCLVTDSLGAGLVAPLGLVAFFISSPQLLAHAGSQRDGD